MDEDDEYEVVEQPVPSFSWQWKSLLIIWANHMKRQAESRASLWSEIAFEVAGAYNKRHDANKRVEAGLEIERIVNG